MKTASLKRWAWSYVAAILLIHGILFWNARDRVKRGYPDFTIYYTAGTMLRRGLAAQLYDNVAQYRIQQEFAGDVATRLGALPFNHPPLEAVLFAPFSYFSFPIAYLLWLLINLAILCAVPILLRPYLPLLSKISNFAFVLIALCFFPVFFALVQGQDSILLLLTFVLAYVSLKRDRLYLAGAWLACGLFKFHLVLPFLALLLVQEKSLVRARKILLGFLTAAAALAAICIIAVGPREILAYPRFVLNLEATMAQGAILPSDMPNLRGALYLLAPRLPHFDLFAVSIAAFFFLFSAWMLRRAAPASDALKIPFALLVTFLVGYHGLGYDLCIVGLAGFLLIDVLYSRNDQPMLPPWPTRLMLAGLATLAFSPLQMFLLVRYNQLGWLAWAVIALTLAIAQVILALDRPAAPLGKMSP